MTQPKRYFTVFAVLFVAVVAIVFRLTELQLVKGQEYKEQSERRAHQTIVLTAPRGGIYDRNGRPIVTNRAGMQVTFQRQPGMKDRDINRILLDVCAVITQNEGDVLSSLLPITTEKPYAFSEGMSEEQISAWREEMELGDRSAEDIIAYYQEQFNIDPIYTEEETRFLVGMRYDMLIRGFSTRTAFTVASDVGQETVTRLREQSSLYPGINIETAPMREYVYQNAAAHILGYVGQMSPEEYDAYTLLGYKSNEYIGKQGVEKAFEAELHGTDGTGVAEKNRSGKSLSATVIQPAVPGNNVFLTIDLDVQLAGEAALSETISRIYQNALETGTTKGLDVGGGSFAAVSVKTGELLGLGSYPSYDLNLFRKKYGDWIKDEARPLFNRATQGAYPPGSTFKMITAMAALDTHATDPYEVITDEVIYRLGDYTYSCMANHGEVNMARAIGYSCNYYFYEMGNRLGIDVIDRYAAMFGLGMITGLDLAGEEVPGVVASPAGKEARGDTWYPGHTLQAAIGQDDTLCTPLQLACYTAQLAGNGVRYAPTVLKKVTTYQNNALKRQNTPFVQGIADVSEQTMRIVKEGMRLSATEGTGSGTFADYPIAVACKTGSAEVYSGSDNGIFVAFAPYEDPEIAVAVVVEHAGSGSAVGPVVKAVIDAYLAPQAETVPAYGKNTLNP